VFQRKEECRVADIEMLVRCRSEGLGRLDIGEKH